MSLDTYRLLVELSQKEICGDEITDPEKSAAVSAFLGEVCSGEEIERFKRRMRADSATNSMYPNYFLPPYDRGRKLRLVQGYLPKTNILYTNHYELEIFRLLHRFAPENETVKDMVRGTLRRLEDTCFGNSCDQGECVAAGISVLRFLAAVKPDDTAWIDRLLDPLGDIFLSFGPGQAAIQRNVPVSYLLMALTDIDSSKTRALISQKKEWLLNLLRRGWITGRLSNGKISEGDTYNLLGKYILRNAIGTLPEYADASKYEIYVDKDERCYCRI